ncbi:MAG: class I SAM-dependent methyltransferase [Planctomycetaceae bacterium]|nr:MAG: class I SAM-dependent methyltransferase [Planctomycetaceae bacterium]
MSLPRTLEPELMDSREEVWAYDAMDHRDVNRVFVNDFLEALQAAGLFSEGSLCLTTRPDDARFVDCDAATIRIVDLGTATAQIPIELAQRSRLLQIMAIDFAAGMLDVAMMNVDAAGLRDQIQLDCVDAKHLPYTDGMFDGTISNSLLHHLEHPHTVIAEAIRVTRKHGLLFFRDLLRPSDQASLESLVQTYAADASPLARLLFTNSLHASLSMDDISDILKSLDLPCSGLHQTTDRHWTLSIRRT